MITMLWKELRENAKWGALALLGLLMAEFYAINQDQIFGFYVQESTALNKSSFLMITTFGCAAVGLVLGFVQMLPEQRRDQWAALIHRPVERATIFRGKAVAGLLLYLIATIPPFLACVWYASKPGHFAAPFTPRMVFPGVADICAGAMYYFAALFVSLQRGAWWSTRGFGVLAALSGSFFVTTNYLPFYVVIEAAVVMSLALFTAAWAAMLTNGTFKGRPWIGKFATLAVVFYGLCAVGAIALMIVNAFERPHYYFGKNYVIGTDGVPVTEQTDESGHSHYFDLDGKALPTPKTNGGRIESIDLQPISGYTTDPHGISQTQRFDYGYREAQTYASVTNVYDMSGGDIWYYVPHEQLFEGFNRYNKAPVGSIGEDGYAPDAKKAQSFHKRMGAMRGGQINSFVRFGQTIYYLDLTNRLARPVFVSVNAPISGAGNISPYNSDLDLRSTAAIVLPDHALVIDKTGKPLATVTYDQDVNRWGALAMGLKSLQGPLFVEFGPSDWIPFEQRRTMSSYLEEYDMQGHLQKTYTLPPLPGFSFPGTWQQWISDTLKSPAYFYGSMVYQKIGAMLGSGHLAGQLHSRLTDMWGYTKSVATRITILSLICAVIALVWARHSQFSWREAWKWAGFTFLFNLAGLITFRLAADWPVRIKCPFCGKPRRVDHDVCPACGALWPVPKRDGTEIADEVPVPAEV